MKKELFECVLPDSGRFARIRRMLWRDALTAFSAGPLLVPTLASLTVHVDDKLLTVDEWLEMDFEDIAPIINELNRRFATMSASRGAG